MLIIDRHDNNERGELTNTYTLNQYSLRNNRLRFKTSWKLSIILEESMEYTLN